ncbi:hypothetical protein [Aequorivita viscosa]|uniref:Uncharacterized protein n=1 Tax=Aequorivita viscosa TaxID=797419 RepID=A0A1M6M2Y8_9FLAO|nr:hypothetical protein [Aequorivita viscosa]SDX31083.1 hypothetical protein SAMN05216556_12425 [Aequorivita viscosa]SHJ77786.1 hypothetical protein SAMN04487908_12535 [Aequorivita viscosa]
MNFKGLVFGFLFFLIISNGQVYSQQCHSYRVINIDSTENYYLISVERNHRKFLIVSLKKPMKPQRKILLSESYCFQLLKHKWMQELPVNVSDIPTSLIIEGKTIWSTEDDYSVYSTKNLKGLNYVKRGSCPN